MARFSRVTTPILSIIVASLLLFFGERLYWLFVGGIGFVVGMELATRGIVGQPAWIILLAAILAGVIGAVLAMCFQRLAIGLAGFLAGGYLAQLAAVSVMGARTGQGSVVVFVIGGLVAAILAVVLLDWALIATSALLGAAMISQWMAPDPVWRAAAFVALFLAGAAVQSRMLRRRPVGELEDP